MITNDARLTREIKCWIVMTEEEEEEEDEEEE